MLYANRRKIMKPVDQQTILITDGIGRLTALSLAGQQAKLLVHGKNKDKVARVAA
jgi:NADP-dependent 3-hydroxy acid dehydrogenase YdfG